MSTIRLTALYPHPTDTAAFDRDYQAHLDLFHEKTGIPRDQDAYTVTKFGPTPEGAPPYYQMFTTVLPSMEALADPRMQDIAADAVRISSGGAPVVLIGADL